MDQEKNLKGLVGQQLNRYCEDSEPVGKNLNPFAQPHADREVFKIFYGLDVQTLGILTESH